MRGFFAFGLNSHFAAELEAAAGTLPLDPALKPLLAADFHVTIKFLSNFSSTDFFACLDELCAIGKPPANSLRAGRIALWPTVLALECEPTEELRAWHSRVNACSSEKDSSTRGTLAFSPHITLARRKANHALPGIEARLPSLELRFTGKPIPFETARPLEIRAGRNWPAALARIVSPFLGKRASPANRWAFLGAQAAASVTISAGALCEGSCSSPACSAYSFFLAGIPNRTARKA